MQILCGNCGRTSKVDDGLAAKSITCSHCGHEIAIPSAESAPARYIPQEYAPADEGGFAGRVQREMARKLVITCGACGKNLKSSRRTIGKKVRCPSCGKKIRVPMPKEEELADGIGTRTVGMNLQIADLEADLEEALTIVQLPKAELVHRGPPIWVWLALAAVLGAAAGIIIWVICT